MTRLLFVLVILSAFTWRVNAQELIESPTLVTLMRTLVNESMGTTPQSEEEIKRVDEELAAFRQENAVIFQVTENEESRFEKAFFDNYSNAKIVKAGFKALEKEPLPFLMQSLKNSFDKGELKGAKLEFLARWLKSLPTVNNLEQVSTKP